MLFQWLLFFSIISCQCATDTRSIAITAVFAAIAIALIPAFSRIAIPAPFAPFLSYQIWEIPIIAVFFIVGPKYGVSAAVVAGAILFAFFLGPVSLGDVFASLSVLLGIYIAYKLLNRKNPQEKTIYGKKAIISYVVLGTVFRVLIMAVLDYMFFLRPIGGVPLMDESLVLSVLLLIAVFNATQPLYTIPIGSLIAQTVSKNLKIGNQLQM